MAQSGDFSGQLKYVPFTSLVDTTFWHSLCKKKLEDLKLDDSPLEARAFYRNDQAEDLPAFITLDYQSLRSPEDADGNSSEFSYQIPLDIIIKNSLEEFKKIDKLQLIQTFADKLWHSMCHSKEDVPLALTRSLLLTYLDLKKFIFYYWFAFPSFNWPSPTDALTSKARVVSQIFSDKLMGKLNVTLNEETNQSWMRMNPYFLICISKQPATNEEQISLLPLLQLKYLDSVESSNEIIYLTFADPCKNSQYPGWPLRNLLVYVTINFPHLKTLKIFCYRSTGRDASCSLSFDIQFNNLQIPKKVPLAVGWEKNARGKLLPRDPVDLSAQLDPVKLAQNAVTLNLKLMRWRLVPTLDLQVIANAKCLLLGSGTLGCNVARALLGWGVECITMLDNGKVSFSNPVRQSLFTFADCLDGGKEKSIAASNALRDINPNLKVTGVQLSIPMPGHSVSREREADVEATVTTLEKLIQSHDVIFLLMDTRESRWLPTVLGQVNQKLVINSALGFDSYLVQRHGIRKDDSPSSESVHLTRRTFIPGSELGCYYCSDVVAPGDSTRDRTLDQQCTVTRPGVSMMAAATAVELMVSVLQHPMGPDAPASIYTGSQEDGGASHPHLAEDECSLGIIPHQVRAFLSRFQQLLPATAAFSNCSACSRYVLNEYRDNRFQFLLRVFNEPGYLDQVSGLKQLQDETSLQDVWALSDDDADSCAS